MILVLLSVLASSIDGSFVVLLSVVASSIDDSFVVCRCSCSFFLSVSFVSTFVILLLLFSLSWRSFFVCRDVVILSSFFYDSVRFVVCCCSCSRFLSFYLIDTVFRLMSFFIYWRSFSSSFIYHNTVVTQIILHFFENRLSIPSLISAIDLR